MGSGFMDVSVLFNSSLYHNPLEYIKILGHNKPCEDARGRETTNLGSGANRIWVQVPSLAM